MGWFTHDHGRKELATEPCAASWADGLFNDGHVDVGVLGELIGAGKASGTGSNNDYVGISVGDHISHVPAGHFTGDNGFFDGAEFEVVEVIGRGWAGGHRDGEVLWGGFNGGEGF